LLPVIFFERCKAHDLLEHFKQGFAGIPFDKMIQVSMDGPNVNWSFLSKLEQELVIELTQENLETLGRFELGLCGLHVGHRAFRSGHDAVDWKVQQALTCGYWFFKESTLKRPSTKISQIQLVCRKKFVPLVGWRTLNQLKLYLQFLRIWKSI
jgi:hypothetical protein